MQLIITTMKLNSRVNSLGKHRIQFCQLQILKTVVLKFGTFMFTITSTLGYVHQEKLNQEGWLQGTMHSVEHNIGEPENMQKRECVNRVGLTGFES